MNFDYINKIKELIDIVEKEESQNMNDSVDILVKALNNNYSIYIFGASHAGILSQEAFYRAGGLALINPIFAPEVSVERQPITLTSKMERLEGYGETIASTVEFKENDVLIVHSVSGRNPITIEIAKAAKDAKATVIGITNLKYSKSVTSRHSSGKNMYEYCDIVLDNHGEIGDACVEVSPAPQKVGPTSTIIGSTMLNAIIVEVAKVIAKQNNGKIPFFASANMDGGDKFNNELFKEYKEQIHYKY